MKTIRYWIFASLCLAISTASFAQVMPYKYSVASASGQVLPNTFGGDESVATDVSDSGAVVGWARMSLGIPHAFLYNNGTLSDIGASQGLLPSWAYGINNVGDVVGMFTGVDKDYGFYWHVGTGFVQLNSEADYGASAQAINDVGTIAGHAYVQILSGPDVVPACSMDISIRWPNAYAAPEAFYCPDDELAAHAAYDLSNSGWIVGTSVGSEHRGYRVNGDVWEDVPPPTNGYELEIRGVNEGGVVAGFTVAPQKRAIIWNGASATSIFLDMLPGGKSSAAYEINNQRFVAGYSQKVIFTGGGLNAAWRKRAVLWHTDFGAYELPVPSSLAGGTATDCEANSLNNRASADGLIRVVGYCTQSGKKKAVRWDVITTRLAWLPALK